MLTIVHANLKDSILHREKYVSHRILGSQAVIMNVAMLSVKSVCELTFQRNVLPPSSGSNISRKNQQFPSHLLHAGFLLGWFSTLKMKMISYSETSVHIRTTQRYISEGGNIHVYFDSNYHFSASNYENFLLTACSLLVGVWTRCVSYFKSYKTTLHNWFNC
jgi:hypothetical protein